MEKNKQKGGYRRVAVSLTRRQQEWLASMSSKHGLSSSSKAARCCVNCVALGDAVPVASADANADGCSNCDERGDALAASEIELSEEQAAWLAHNSTGSDSFFSERVIGTCMAIDEYTVFGVIRCKSSVAKCEGAQGAIAKIGETFDKKEDDVVVKENIDISPPPPQESAKCEKKCGCA